MTCWKSSHYNIKFDLIYCRIHCGDDVVTSFFSDYDNAMRPGFGKIMLSLNQSIFITCEGGGRGGAVLKDFYGSHGFQGDEGGIS